VGDPCAEVGEEFVLEIWITMVPTPIVGVQFFLEYSDQTLELVAVEQPDPPSPFSLFPPEHGYCVQDMLECTRELKKNEIPCCIKNERIDLAAIVFVGTRLNHQLAKLRFRVLSMEADSFLRFRKEHDPPMLMTTSTGFAIAPIAADLESGGVSLRDFADFQNCFSGTEAALSGCRCSLDFTGDDLVDLADFLSFLPAFTGPTTSLCP
jgi:hypothetical protein